jgi:hypothetical protein
MRMSDIPRRLASESRLDRAIDRAVRDMMHVDPHPGFRSRVLARLEPEPARFAMVMRLAIVAGALAVLVLGVMVIRPDRRSDLPGNIAQETTPRAQSAPQGAVSRKAPAGGTNTAATRVRGRRPRGERLTSEPISMPPVTNVFGDRSGAAAASVGADTVWPAPPPETQDERSAAPAPLVIPPLEPPAPIVIPPLNSRGPGEGRP